MIPRAQEIQPLDAFSIDDRHRIKGVFADIDDTINLQGRLTAGAGLAEVAAALMAARN